MDSLNRDIKEKILNFLKTKNIGASSSEIAKHIGHNRVTVSKYLEIMKARGLLDYEAVANAKLWRINKKNQKPTILIVDDEKHIVDLISLSLIQEQYNILKSYSGKDALDVISKSVPDLIILDLMMPEIDGYEVCRRVRENPVTQHIPVIILTAKSQVRDKLKGLNLGADDYVVKPFDPMELEARVKAKLRQSSFGLDANPLSKLPGIDSFKKELVKWIVNKSHFFITRITINKINEIISECGYKKLNEAIALIAKVFAEKAAEKGAYFAHTANNSFLMLSSENLSAELESNFRKILPYVIKKELGVSLNFKSISKDDITNKNLDADNILSMVGE